MATRIRAATSDDLDAWVALRQALWSGEISAHRSEAGTYFRDGTIAGLTHGVFLAERGEAGATTRLIGFAECSLRTVEPNQPAGSAAHLEGWFVQPDCRRQGIGRGLIGSVLAWARQHGCTRLTSDTTTSYAAHSLPAHRACGFERNEFVAGHVGPAEDGMETIGFWRVV